MSTKPFGSTLSALALATIVFAADKTIKIGALLPMSGPGSYFGAQDKQGIELALEALNKSGVDGFKFEVQYEDSACSPLPATQAAKRILDQYKPDIAIGEECSDATLAIMPVTAQAKVPFLNAGSSSIKITDPGNPWTFRPGAPFAGGKNPRRDRGASSGTGRSSFMVGADLQVDGGYTAI